MGVLRVVLVLCLVSEVHSILRLSANAKHKGLPDLSNEIGKRFEDEDNPLKKVGDGLKNTQKKIADKLKRDPPTEQKNKKPMDPVETMRAMMCWGREKLMEHEDCMEFMTKNCAKETTGEGYCKKLRRYVKSECKKGREKACVYAGKLGIDVATDKEEFRADDADADGVPDKDDAFPDNPFETKDSDGDGVGDNADRFPNDPTCSDDGDLCGGATVTDAPAPAPSLAMSPAPAPASMDENVPLPSQGYNEHSTDYVAHDDGKTMTRDWRAEWPRTADGNEETSIKRICDENPNLAWCNLKQSTAARKAYALAHP